MYIYYDSSNKFCTTLYNLDKENVFQKGNPVLKFIKSVPWEYDDIVPDYQMAPTRCALFLR